jgi:hypothetical protein
LGCTALRCAALRCNSPQAKTSPSPLSINTIAQSPTARPELHLPHPAALYLDQGYLTFWLFDLQSSHIRHIAIFPICCIVCRVSRLAYQKIIDLYHHLTFQSHHIL